MSNEKQALIKPTVFVSPYNVLRYAIVTDLDQYRLLKAPYKDLANHEFELQSFRAVAYVDFHTEIGYFGTIYYPTMLEDDFDTVMRTLCHECVHIWQDYSEKILAERNPSYEFEAYTIDEFFGNAIKEWGRLLTLQKEGKKPKPRKKAKPTAIEA